MCAGHLAREGIYNLFFRLTVVVGTRMHSFPFSMANQSLIAEFWEFLKVRKRLWLLPIILVLFLLGTVIVFTESSVIAPFIYALF